MAPRPLQSAKTGPLSGIVRVPGDKSISHRALMFGAIAIGETTIHGLLTGEDVLHTAAAMRALGAGIIRSDDGVWRVRGVGIGGLVEANQVLDMGNSGTAARLMMGLVASHPITTFFTGDASLAKRPMARVTTPLEQMGASFVSRTGGRLPLAVIGTENPVPITYRLPVASAQVKSAILLAGLNTPGITTVIETEPTRDHSELMLTHFGATVTTERIRGRGARRLHHRRTRNHRPPGPRPRRSQLRRLPDGRGLDPARLRHHPDRCRHEPAPHRPLRHPDRDGRRHHLPEPSDRSRRARRRPPRPLQRPDRRRRPAGPRALDDRRIPDPRHRGRLRRRHHHMHGLAELRVKESDRLAMVADGLGRLRGRCRSGPDSLTVHGAGVPPGGATVATAMDHRIAMSFLVLGMASAEPVAVDDRGFIDTSFPGFVDLMNGLGARISQPNV